MHENEKSKLKAEENHLKWFSQSHTKSFKREERARPQGTEAAPQQMGTTAQIKDF